MDGMKNNIEDWNKDMEGWKEGLTKLLQERLPDGEKVIEQTHNENKKNVNHDLKNDKIEDLEIRGRFEGRFDKVATRKTS